MRSRGRSGDSPRTRSPNCPRWAACRRGRVWLIPGGARCSWIAHARPAGRARRARVRCRAGYPQPARIGQDETGLVSERRLRVGLVVEPTGIDDPYGHGAYLGLERAVGELGIRGRVLTPAPKEGYV